MLTVPLVSLFACNCGDLNWGSWMHPHTHTHTSYAGTMLYFLPGYWRTSMGSELG